MLSGLARRRHARGARYNPFKIYNAPIHLVNIY